MSTGISAPLLLSVLVLLLLGLVAWGFLKLQAGEPGDSLAGTRDGLMLAFLVLAVIALGTFLVYGLLSVGL